MRPPRRNTWIASVIASAMAAVRDAASFVRGPCGRAHRAYRQFAGFGDDRVDGESCGPQALRATSCRSKAPATRAARGDKQRQQAIVIAAAVAQALPARRTPRPGTSDPVDRVPARSAGNAAAARGCPAGSGPTSRSGSPIARSSSIRVASSTRGTRRSCPPRSAARTSGARVPLAAKRAASAARARRRERSAARTIRLRSPPTPPRASAGSASRAASTRWRSARFASRSAAPCGLRASCGSGDDAMSPMVTHGERLRRRGVLGADGRGSGADGRWPIIALTSRRPP